tara:strand:- start:1227 stop:1829 length:603 start_codon:yes stop_codon:yes gene_type:complete
MNNVKSYTDKGLIDRMKSLPSFRYVPRGKHMIVLRSKEDAPDRYDDKLYLFDYETCLDVMSCTSNSGTYGLLNFAKWNRRGTAVIKFDEVYYDAFMKSDGKKVRHHNGRMQGLRQIGFLKYFRDFNKDKKIDATGRIYEGNNSTNVHCNSYKWKKGIKTWLIGRFGTGCTVINDLTKYYNVLLKNIPYNTPITYTGLNEF